MKHIEWIPDMYVCVFVFVGHTLGVPRKAPVLIIIYASRASESESFRRRNFPPRTIPCNAMLAMQCGLEIGKRGTSVA